MDNTFKLDKHLGDFSLYLKCVVCFQFLNKSIRKQIYIYTCLYLTGTVSSNIFHGRIYIFLMPSRLIRL